MTPAEALAHAIRHPKRADRPAIMPYLTCGYPSRDGFASLIQRVAEVADVIEVGVPFSDPMADGPVIQASSHAALQQGVTLRWILDTLRGLPQPLASKLVLMSYLNPLLAFGLAPLVDELRELGFGGMIVPDLPWEEGGELRGLLDDAGMAFIQLVTPVTQGDRLVRLTRGPGGFVYAVTITGTTGAAMNPAEVAGYLDRVRSVSKVPVCAGFGIRSADHVRGLAGHADGVVVGSALIEALGRGEDGADFIRGLLA